MPDPQEQEPWAKYAQQPAEQGPWSNYAQTSQGGAVAPQETPSQNLINFDTLGRSITLSNMLGVPVPTAYHNDDLVHERLKAQGIDLPRTMPSIANDIKVGAEASIFGLSYRDKLPEVLKDPNMFDRFVSGVSEMVADLPFYLMGAAGGAAAGTEVPVVGNVAGAAIGTFAVPAAIRESLVQGIQKGDIKSFGDLMERTLSVAREGFTQGGIGLLTEASGGATLPMRAAFGPGAVVVETAMKKLQQAATLTTLSKLSEGKLPTADDFAVNSALLIAMHYSVAALDKATDVSAKVHDRVMNTYVDNGTHPATIAAEALTRAQEAPTEAVIDRINEISRGVAPTEEPTEATKEVEQETAVPEAAPALLRPAIREKETGVVHAGVEGEYHPDIVERTGNDDERGFVTRDDQFLTRDEAKAKLHEEEPEVYDAWVRQAGGPDEEFHTTDYNAARQELTGIKNAAVDVQRAQRDLAPLESSPATTRDAVYGQAKADVDAGKVDPLDIAQSVVKNPRGLSDAETDALNYYNRKLSDQEDAAMEAVRQARDNDDPRAEQTAKERFQSISDKRDIVEQAARIGGTQSGRALRARQEMIKQDYSLSRVLFRARTVSKTGELSPEVQAELESLVDSFKRANDRLEAYQAKQVEGEGKRAVERMKEEAARGERKAARKEQRIDLDTEFDGLLKEFDSLVGRMSANPFLDPDLAAVVGKMALNRVKSGITRFEDIVDYVHGKLTDIGHEFTKRELADAISGYGKVAEMSKDAIKVALRDVKRQGRLLSALEDAQAALAPLKSGLQRDAASERVAELQKQVRAAMRESGVDARSSQTPEQQWKSAIDSVKTRLRNQLSDIAKEFQTLTKAPERKGLPEDAETRVLKAARDTGRRILETLEGKPKVSPERKLKMAMEATQRSLDEYDRRIKENDLTPTQRQAGTPETPELKALRERRDALRETYRQMQDAAKPKKSPEQVALDRYKKVLTNRIDDMERQLSTGDFTKEPSKPLVLDQEATDLKVKAEKARAKVDEAVAKQKRETRSKTEKVVEGITKWRRAALLTGYSTLGKLTNAAMQRMGVTPVEELLGGVLSHIPGIDKISERAPMHGGGMNVSAEVKAVSQLWQKATAADMWEELVHGQDSLDRLFGGKTPLPPEVLGFFGQLHGALKVPEKRAEFFRRFEIGMEWAKRNHLDVGDPRVQSGVAEKVSIRAYDESLRAILMQPNPLTKGYSGLLAVLHESGDAGRMLEAGLRFAFPMVRVATNLPAEALAYTPVGLFAQTIHAIRLLADKDKTGTSALEQLSIHDFDNVMRGLKKGSVGLALSAIGFAFRKNITGYYLSESDKKRGIKRGVVKIGGVSIPSYLSDTPPMIAIQLAATVGHVWDHYNMKGMSGGLVAGAAQAAGELAKQIPFYGQAARGAEATTTPERTMVGLGDLTGSVLIPRLISQIAEAGDKDKKRKATTFGEAIKLQIPGLRQTVRHHLRAR